MPTVFTHEAHMTKPCFILFAAAGLLATSGIRALQAQPKPDPVERRGVPHHLIDILPPEGEMSLARYQDLAYAAIDGVLARARLPLLVGGTPLYVNAVVEGWHIPRVPRISRCAPPWSRKQRRAALQCSPNDCTRSIPSLRPGAARI